MIGLLLIGPPRVGKGTQAARLREELELTHIVTGDLVREHRARGTELGIQASQYMSSGGGQRVIRASPTQGPTVLLDHGQLVE